MNNTNNLEAIGKRISLTRRAKGMTQENLAEKLGVSPKHISHIECGTSSLSLKSLIEFVKYLIAAWITLSLETVNLSFFQNYLQKLPIFFIPEQMPI